MNPLPAVLYHGTNYSFEQFDPKYLGRACRNPATELGFFFSDDAEDALSWALREQERSILVPRSARIIEVALHLTKVKELSESKFLFYLQRAKTSTIQRDRESWIAEGYDGLAVTRGGHRWYAPFKVSAIEILAKDRNTADVTATSKASRSTLPRP